MNTRSVLSTQRGAGLLLALATLALMSVLAVSFVRLTRTEQAAARNHLYVVHARMASEAGLEQARGRLLEHYRTAVVDSPDPLVTPWVFGHAPTTELRDATHPSLHGGSFTVAGQARGYTSVVADPAGLTRAHLPSIDRDEGVSFSLRICDLNARININDANPNLGRMLDNLGAAIALYEGVTDPVGGAGARIMADRDALFGGQFGSVADLGRLPYLPPEGWRTLAQYVTTRSWRDTSVLEPSPQLTTPNDFDDLPFMFHVILYPLHLPWPHYGPIREHYDFEPVRDTAGNVVGRAPININTAAPAVLYACVRDLLAHGYEYRKRVRLRGMAKFSPGEFWGWAKLGAIDHVAALEIVKAIVARRALQPIHSFYDLAGLLPTKHRRLVLANADPNTRLVKHNPDRSFIGHGVFKGGAIERNDVCDKTDLVYWTTEFVFAAHGYFEIESLGRVRSPQGILLSEHQLIEQVRLFDVQKHTTQQDFESQRVGINDRTTKTLPESMADQGFDVGRASRLDGQIIVADDTRALGARWSSQYEGSLFGGPKSADRRWSASALWPKLGKHDGLLIENHPADGKQTPMARSILRENDPVPGRTSRKGSNLLPDGRQTHLTKIGVRELQHQVVQRPVKGLSGRSNILPGKGAIEFWFKPDHLGRILFYEFGRWNGADPIRDYGGWLILGPGSKTIPATGEMPYRRRVGRYAWVHTATPGKHATQFEGYHCQFGLGGVYAHGGKPQADPADGFYLLGKLNPLARASAEIAYPYSQPFRSDTPVHQRRGPSYRDPGERFGYRRQEWNHMRITWDRFVDFRTYLNGKEVSRNHWQFVHKSGNSIDHKQSIYDGGNPLLDFFSVLGKCQTLKIGQSTLDQVRVTVGAHPSGLADHYQPTDGGTQYRGRFHLPATSGKLRVLSYRFSATPGWGGFASYRKSTVSVLFDHPAAPKKAAFSNVSMIPPAQALDLMADPKLGLTYRVRFHDGGQTPFTQTPYFDDITVFYEFAAGPRSLSRRTVE